ncbi:mediator of RNA polymerase II transcription subunit 10 isoform X2 [Bombina bombina]|uniref:mediator of RNA polymerase II transcription subunit 10 isoform X2 n=1 Tax=Bombina bombina TaxID=8345 RepID=UPI00235ABC36|nr:mediator of RNA polymerase II transcription subunit 10 isoform X2 [Bombina bombina]
MTIFDVRNGLRRPEEAGAAVKIKKNFMVTGLQDIDKCRAQLHDISVPLEVFDYIDQGRNPQLYTKECLERALAKNEQVKGKIDTMKKFKSMLIQELSKVFPEDMAKYKAIRGGEEHPPS